MHILLAASDAFAHDEIVLGSKAYIDLNNGSFQIHPHISSRQYLEGHSIMVSTNHPGQRVECISPNDIGGYSCVSKGIDHLIWHQIRRHIDISREALNPMHGPADTADYNSMGLQGRIELPGGVHKTHALRPPESSR